MSITIRCDRCGKEKTLSGVVSNSYTQHGFKELSIEWPGGIKDVCEKCYKEIARAHTAAEDEQRTSIRQRVIEMLGMKGKADDR